MWGEGETLKSLWLLVSRVSPKDLVDLVLVWAVVYRAILLTKRSGAVQILSGMAVLGIAYLLAHRFELVTFYWLLESFFSNLFLIVVILFQAEIRRALAQLGTGLFFGQSSLVEETHMIEEIAKGAIQLAQKGIGALIVIERDIALDYFIEVGTEVDSALCSETLNSIFLPMSPLHDGACVIRNGRILWAGCFLPLSKSPDLDRNLGTRHRAAIGLTEETDAIVLVVSEESRSVGFVSGGQLIPDIDHGTLRKKLYDVFDVKVKDRG